jgi:hypothetical protein
VGSFPPEQIPQAADEFVQFVKEGRMEDAARAIAAGAGSGYYAILALERQGVDERGLVGAILERGVTPGVLGNAATYYSQK